MDSCRYDSFEKANAPGFKSLGQLWKCYSTACWTIPSLVSLAFGLPPLEPPFLGRLFYVKDYKIKKILTPNPLVIQERNRIFKGWSVEGLKYDYLRSSAQIFEDAKSFLETVKEPFLLLLLLMETHSPYWDGHRTYGGVVSKPEEGVSMQARCVEHIDSNFRKILYNTILALHNLRIIITADHGEMFGEEKNGLKGYHHNIEKQRMPFHSKLFEIPFILRDQD
ncbi:sulfatase-like hydrolase/transferase [Candidatus Bathyarchaeota archaeon]|nr:sulfatase-like hydrolase/transferase [Candidatus Bathyarchaeota archaeon]